MAAFLFGSGFGACTEGAGKTAEFVLEPIRIYSQGGDLFGIFYRGFRGDEGWCMYVSQEDFGRSRQPFLPLR